MDLNKTLIVALLIALQIILGCNGSKILFIYPIATRSETHVFLPLAKELHARNHQVTVISPNNRSSIPVGLRQLVPVPYLMADNFFQHIPAERERSKNKYSYLFGFNPRFNEESCHRVFQNLDFQRIIQEPFDLLVFSGWFNTCFYGLVTKMQVPFILITSMPSPQWITSLSGFELPTSVLSIPILFQERMTFLERFTNNAVIWTYKLFERFLMSPFNTGIYREYLGADYPTVSEIERNVSMIFSNSHFSFTYPRPLPPDVIEIAGIHCRPPLPLADKTMDKFINEAKHGTILFSLGSMVQAKNFPESYRLIFRNVFSRLKERVIWKWDTGLMNDLPPNVMLSKWLPQQDVLGHTNIKLFITHGGLLSVTESTYHGIPMIGLPIFVDQDYNMKAVTTSGYGLTLEFLELTEVLLEGTIHEVLSNSSYTRRVQEVSKIFHDQPFTALERAAFWTEYVLRHNGAKHLRSAARELTFIQYHSIDCMALMALIIATPILIMYALIRIMIYKCCFNVNNSSTASSNGSNHVAVVKKQKKT